MFTGSTEVARLIQRELATRLSADGSPIPGTVAMTSSVAMSMTSGPTVPLRILNS